MRDFWRVNFARHTAVHRYDGGRSVPKTETVREMFRAAASRPAPLKATLGYSMYCSCLTTPFIYLHLAGRPGPDALLLELKAYELVEHLVGHAGAVQSVTSFLASALFLMIGFRINRATSRWWFGGQLFGRLMSSTRNLTLTAQLAINEKAVAVEAGMLAYAHARAVELTLRHASDDEYIEVLKNLLTDSQLESCLNASNRPVWLLQHMTLRFSHAYDAQQVKNVRLLVALMNDIEKMMNIDQEMLRIQGVAEPWTYQKHMRLTTQLWLGLLPIAILPSVQFATPLFCGVIGYVVYKLDDVARELTNPFGLDHSDLGVCLLNDQLQREIADMLVVYARDDPRKGAFPWEAWGGVPPGD